MDVKEALKTLENNLCTGDAKGRNICVLERGWIFIGDLLKTDDGYIINNAANIRKWTCNGFGGLCKSRAGSGAVLDEAGTVRVPNRSMLFYVPVGESW